MSHIKRKVFDAVRENDKTTFRQSPTAQFRYRKPVNVAISDAATQFVFDHKRCVPVIPDRNATALIEATAPRITRSGSAITSATQQGGGVRRGENKDSAPKVCINRTGRTAAGGALERAELGGSPDEAGMSRKLSRRY